ncbi:MAG: hypothetical protein DLM69_07010 [Candidatus Chloroheliales bacterium]|nr:MAG: hypothetical protein DLM69_07010 [Chloroflexota bacterium]
MLRWRGLILDCAGDDIIATPLQAEVAAGVAGDEGIVHQVAQRGGVERRGADRIQILEVILVLLTLIEGTRCRLARLACLLLILVIKSVLLDLLIEVPAPLLIVGSAV